MDETNYCEYNTSNLEDINYSYERTEREWLKLFE